jgi:pimeloyl-ACP methyl ester carboxylesterase
MRRRRFAILLSILAMIGLSGAWLFGSLMARPVNHAEAPPGPPARPVHLIARDGVPLAGSLWPGARPGAPAVLLLHGVDASRAQMTRHALWLNGLGYAVLAIDFRGHGGSGAVSRSFGLHEGRDAAAALAFLRASAPERRVAIIGVSLGGAAALLGEDGPLPVQAMVLQGVYPDLRTAIANRIASVAGRPAAWLGEPLLSYQSPLRYGVWPDRIAPREAIRSFRGALYVIGGTEDRSTTVEDTRTLHRAAAARAALWLVDGADHVAISTLWSDDYRRRVGAFLAEALGPL